MKGVRTILTLCAAAETVRALAENGSARDCAERGMRMSQALLRARQNGEAEEAAAF